MKDSISMPEWLSILMKFCQKENVIMIKLFTFILLEDRMTCTLINTPRLLRVSHTKATCTAMEYTQELLRVSHTKAESTTSINQSPPQKTHPRASMLETTWRISPMSPHWGLPMGNRSWLDCTLEWKQVLSPNKLWVSNLTPKWDPHGKDRALL